MASRHDAAMCRDSQDSYVLVIPVPKAVCALLLTLLAQVEYHATIQFLVPSGLAQKSKMKAALLLSPAQHFSSLTAAPSRQSTQGSAKAAQTSEIPPVDQHGPEKQCRIEASAVHTG